jgi:hypothetical protein
MVFRRKAKRSRRIGYKARRSRGSSGGLGITDLLIGGAIYGFARPKVADMLPPLFQFGPVDSDNAIIAGAGYLGMKNSNKIIRATSMIAIAGETAIVANRLGSGMSSTGSTGQSGETW